MKHDFCKLYYFHFYYDISGYTKSNFFLVFCINIVVGDALVFYYIGNVLRGIDKNPRIILVCVCVCAFNIFMLYYVQMCVCVMRDIKEHSVIIKGFSSLLYAYQLRNRPKE